MNKSSIFRKKKGSLFVSFCSFIAIFLILLLPSCRLYNLERKLDSVNAEFLSKVRYIITKEERKIFLELPDEEKDKFKEEFWKRRDPDLSTEENEFKIEYFNRIERANELFLGEGKPGFLTDRGRIYVLFGPPTDRIRNPMGASSYTRCTELWYYGGFPVIFVDYYCNGTYELRTLSLAHLHDLNLAQAYTQKTFKREKEFFDFYLEVKKTLLEVDRVEGVIVIEVPYAVIWFKSKDDKLETTLDVHLELKDFAGDLIWEYKDSFMVRTDEEELQQKRKKNYTIEIPFILEEDLEKLRQGKNLIHILLKNRTGDEESKKVMEFSL